MAFFEDLGNAINEQFGFGENTLSTLDSTADGRVVNFGLLGEFANKFDQSAERSYIEDGFVRNVRPKLREVLWQEPDVTIVVKKRMFSSLAENFRLDLMNEDEKLFIRASKRLFQNKCRAIAAYERLTKIERIVKESGQINSFMLPTILSGFSTLEDVGLGGIFGNKAKAALQTLRKAYNFSEPVGVTTWLIDNETPFMSDLGEGTGAFELTLVSNLSTTVSTEFAAGGAQMTIEAPYKLLSVDSEDIDRAIADATNALKTGGFGRLTEIETQRLIENQKSDLDRLRAARGVSRIQFVINAQTLISKRVRAIVESEGREIRFNFDSGFLGIPIARAQEESDGIVKSGVEIDRTEFEGPNALTDAEATLFGEIIRNIFLYLGFQNTSRNEKIEFNKKTNYVRRKMRLHFAGKYIIQPMDIINIFVTSKTISDDKLTKGFELNSRGLNVGQRLDNLVRNINTTLNDLAGNGDTFEDAEKAAIVGPDFPTWLWRLVKNQFTRQAAGTAVFVGLAKTVAETWNDGKYILNLNCEDNAGYFDKGQVNIKPALDVFNQTLYDPLTPFKVSFDEATGTTLTDIGSEFPELLDENRLLLNSSAVRFKNGRFRGNRASEELLKARNIELSFNGFRSVLNEPDGFVYRWKEGIGSITKTERAIPDASIREERSPLLTADPFAGQDVMNVISLLITGQPYNYNTFLKSAIMNGNGLVSRNEVENADAAVTYIEGLTADLAKRNSLWGNFVPFKKLLLSEDADQFLRQGEGDLIKLNTRLSGLLQERARLQDEFYLRKRGLADNVQAVSRDELGQSEALPEGSSFPGQVGTLERQIADLDRQIEDARVRFELSVNSQVVSRPTGNIKIIGNDISTDPSLTEEANSFTERKRRINKADFRKRLDLFTQRRLWKVKSNDDVNLFVVDDQYDKNYDIQAFERKISKNINLFASEYVDVKGKIKQVADILGMEVFADSQGHIQVRPHQFNKVPSSVMFRMIKEKHEKGIQVFPQFLESLFFNQIQGIMNQLEIIEDEIRLRAGALGAVTDDAVVSLISQRGAIVNGSIPIRGPSNFSFITNRTTGRINNELLNRFVQQSKPDLNEEILTGALKSVRTTFAQEASKQRIFDVTSRLSIIKDEQFISGIAEQDVEALEDIRARLRRKKGTVAPTLRELFSNDRFRGTSQVSQLDVLNILNQVAQFISERQTLLLQGTNALRNLEQGASLNSDNQGMTSALFPHLNRKKEIPDILQHMIEDETNNDLGSNSGSRFVIKESQILSLRIEETAPQYTLVQVNGLFAEGFRDAPSNLGLGADQGNALTSAFAVDYDMWRMYGFRTSSSVRAPFFSDPDAQCAPYAVYLLNLARKDILRGSVTLVGNEYYQAGDVVYIEDRDLLFYVTSVQQSFDYSGNYTTTLTLRYGHPPGEYIPNILDIVGKSLYNNRFVATQFKSERFANANGDIPVGALVIDNRVSLDLELQTNFQRLLLGTRGERNKKVLSNLLMALSGALNPVGLRRVRPVLEFRVYHNSETIGSVNQALVNTAEAARAWVINPQAKSIDGISLLPSNEQEPFVVSPNSVRVVVIDFGADTREVVFPRTNKQTDSVNESPSAGAWNVVRNLILDPIPDDRLRHLNLDGKEFSSSNDIILFDHVIDAWITFDNLDETTETGTNQPLSQGAQEFNEKVLEAQRKFAGIT